MKNIIYVCSGFFLVSLFFGCGGSSSPGEDVPENPPSLITLDNSVYITMGDGITSGSGPSGRTWAERLRVKDVDIINLAVSGTHTLYGVDHIDDYMQEYKPSLVMVLYGVNDISAGIATNTIIENLEQIIQVVQYYGGDIILGTIPIVTKYSHLEANEARDLNYQIEELCINYGIECAAVSEKMVYDSDLYLDDLHPTLEGHKYIEAAFRIKISAVMGK